METAEIINKVQLSLKDCAEKNGIPNQEVRIRISRKKGFMASTIKCDLMRKNESVCELNLKDLLGLNPITSSLVNTYLSNSLEKFANNENVDEHSINGRFYTTCEDYTPRLYLFNGESPLREVKIEELIN